MNYTDDHHGNIEVLNGALKQSTVDDWNYHWNHYWKATGLLGSSDTPKDLKDAKSIKFDSLDLSHVTNIRGMLMYSNNLKSVDFGDHFGVSSLPDSPHSDTAWNNKNAGIESLVASNPNLEHVNLGNSFHLKNESNNWFALRMFLGDSKLQKPTGYTPHSVQKAYDGFPWY